MCQAVTIISPVTIIKMLQTPIISVANLNHYFGKRSLRRQVLFNINLNVNPGEIVILTGPSGSGKTTLLSLLAGLRTVQEGSVKLLERQLYRANERQILQLRSQLGYIFQMISLGLVGVCQ